MPLRDVRSGGLWRPHGAPMSPAGSAVGGPSVLSGSLAHGVGVGDGPGDGEGGAVGTEAGGGVGAGPGMGDG